MLSHCYVLVNHWGTLLDMETLKITCPNCGHDAGQLVYEPDRRRNLPPLAPLPDKPILNGPDPQIFGSWLRDSGIGQDGAAGIWHRPADLHQQFRLWWVTEGGAPFAMPSQRRMSAALVALGWTFKKTGAGRLYTPPPPPE